MTDRDEFRIPSWCPVCGMLMKGSKSNTTWFKYKACMSCFIEFIEDREQRWLDGWRPDPERVKAFVARLTS